MDAKYDEKKNMTVWFNEKLELSDEKAKEYADQVEKERINAFVSPNWMKKKLQAILRD
ncbi:Uncharacterised protein [Vibrio owensii]|nr:Uncharacterised protein [Vibrio owensii]